MANTRKIPDLTTDQIELVVGYLNRRYEYNQYKEYLNSIYRAIKPEQIYLAIRAAYLQIAPDNLSGEEYQKRKSRLRTGVRDLLLHYHEEEMKPVNIAATVFTIISFVLIIPMFLRTFTFFHNVFSALPNNRYFSTLKKSRIVEPSFEMRDRYARFEVVDSSSFFWKEGKGPHSENEIFSNKRKNVRKIKFDDFGYHTLFGTREQIAHAKEKADLKKKNAAVVTAGERKLRLR